ncbi:hypothetical protein HU200_041088 [Digitaria exilis]|uniref:Uncharacterized protein n=1 Tax=Digitaria exilis TaxID=1010633 RepID=A0A835B717_9POAL|nr:hypothetical protein HU200_041088 [Digitaria exilis]
MQFCQSLLAINRDLSYQLSLQDRLYKSSGKSEKKIQRPFLMEIIILMSWSIWTTRKDSMFNNLHPSVEACRRKFMLEFSLVTHRDNPSSAMAVPAWLDSLDTI